MNHKNAKCVLQLGAAFLIRVIFMYSLGVAIKTKNWKKYSIIILFCFVVVLITAQIDHLFNRSVTCFASIGKVEFKVTALYLQSMFKLKFSWTFVSFLDRFFITLLWLGANEVQTLNLWSFAFDHPVAALHWSFFSQMFSNLIFKKARF